MLVSQRVFELFNLP